MPVVAAVGRRHGERRLLGVGRAGVFHRPSRFRVYVTGPGDGHVGFGGEELPRLPVEDVEEAVLGRLHDDLAPLPLHLELREDHVLGGGVIPGIAGGGLVVPHHAAVIGVNGHDGGQVEVVTAAGAADMTVPGRAVTHADVEQVELRVVGHGVPDGAAAPNFPPFAPAPGAHGRLEVLAFDGIVRVARDRIEAPGLIPRFRVVGGDEAADAVFTAAVTDDDLAIDHPRRAGDGVGTILRGGLHGPIGLSRAGVESH